jgi:hypothetical protein
MFVEVSIFVSFFEVDSKKPVCLFAGMGTELEIAGCYTMNSWENNFG